MIKKLKLLNRYYQITKFYSFLRKTLINGSLVILTFILLLFLIDYFLIDINSLLSFFVNTLPSALVFVVFFISEIFLGIIPPELFIAWSSKSEYPWVFLSILSTLSYIGGAIAYFIGKFFYEMPYFKKKIEQKAEKHIINLRKWGGLLVFVGAMLPLPHSILSFISGFINYSFKYYSLWALFRFLRFLIYGIIIFRIF